MCCRSNLLAKSNAVKYWRGEGLTKQSIDRRLKRLNYYQGYVNGSYGTWYRVSDVQK